MWSDTEFGNLENLLYDLKGLDGIEEQRPLSSEDILSKEAATIELEKIILLEESWRKKSVVLWLREGEKIPSSSIGWLVQIENVTP